jgi:VWFA-related protein
MARGCSKPSGYTIRARAHAICRNPHISNNFELFRGLTVSKIGTYTDPMISTRARVGLFVVSTLALASSSTTAAQANQKSLWVSVVDGAGQPVTDLGPSDFIVREDNVAREVLDVRPADAPMQIAVLVDTSQAARNDIADMRAALPRFVTALTNPNESGRKNTVALIGFGERPTILTEYTTNPAELQKGINRIWAQQGSGAYFVDAIDEVVQAFKKREATRPVIVAIVAEGRELSYRQYDQVLDPLRSSGAPLYALMIGTPSSSISDEARNRNIVLDRGTTESGGRRDQLLAPSALTDRLGLLAKQLLHQYKVTYARPQSLIPPERTTVATTRPGLTARGTPVKDSQERP